MLLGLASGAVAAPADGGNGARTAAKSGHIVVLGGARDATATARIAAELRAFGFTSQVRRVVAVPDASESERAVRDGARAVVQVDGRAARTEITIVDPAGRTVRVREVLEGTTAAIDALLITRTVELVRATLLGSPPPPNATAAPTAAPESAPAPAAVRPTSTAPPPATATAKLPSTTSSASSDTPSSRPATATGSSSLAPATVSPPSPSASSLAPPAPAPPATVDAEAEPPRRPSAPAPVEAASVERGEPRWRTAVSAGVSVASGGLAPEVVLGARLAARVAGPIHVELLGVAPLTSSPTSTLVGTSRSTAWLFGGGLAARWHRGNVALETGAGALAVWLRSVGSVPAPTPGSPMAATDGVLAAAAYVRGGASLALGRAFAARLDILAGDAFRRLVLKFGETGEPAAWGPVFVTALGGVELAW